MTSLTSGLVRLTEIAFAAGSASLLRRPPANAASGNLNPTRNAQSLRVLVFLLALQTTWVVAWARPGHATAFAYIADGANSGAVRVLDTSTNTVVATVPVGEVPWGVAVNPTGTHVFVANHSSNTISVIETGTNTVVATVPVGFGPYGVTVSPDGKWVYVTIQYSCTGGLQGDSVVVIDASTYVVVAEVRVHTRPERLALTPDGSRLYVANGCGDTKCGSCNSTSTNTISVIDTSSNAVTATLSGIPNPSSIAVTPDGARVYITASDGIWVLDAATNSVVVPRIPRSYSYGISMNPSGTRAYLTERSYPTTTLIVLDTSRNVVVRNVSLPVLNLGATAVTPDGTRVYVAGASGYVSVLDTATNAIMVNIPMATGGVGAIAIGPDISVVPSPTDTPTDTATNTPTATETQTDTATATATNTPADTATNTLTPTVTATRPPDPIPNCAPAPLPGCRTPVIGRTGQLFLRKGKRSAADDSLSWSWRRGAGTSFSDFGDPLTTTSYAVCVYDAVTQGPLMTKGISAAGTCNGQPCWEKDGKTLFRYRDHTGSAGGIRRLILKPGADRQAVIVVAGTGVNLALPPMPLASPVIASDGEQRQQDLLGSRVHESVGESGRQVQVREQIGPLMQPSPMEIVRAAGAWRCISGTKPFNHLNSETTNEAGARWIEGVWLLYCWGHWHLPRRR